MNSNKFKFDYVHVTDMASEPVDEILFEKDAPLESFTETDSKAENYLLLCNPTPYHVYFKISKPFELNVTNFPQTNGFIEPNDFFPIRIEIGKQESLNHLKTKTHFVSIEYVSENQLESIEKNYKSSFIFNESGKKTAKNLYFNDYSFMNTTWRQMLTNQESKQIVLMCNFKGTDGIIKVEKNTKIDLSYRPLYKKNLQSQKEKLEKDNASKISSRTVKVANDTQNIAKEQKESEIVNDPEIVEDTEIIKDSEIIPVPEIIRIPEKDKDSNEIIDNSHFVTNKDSSVIQIPKIQTPVITEQIEKLNQPKETQIQFERPRSEIKSLNDEKELTLNNSIDSIQSNFKNASSSSKIHSNFNPFLQSSNDSKSCGSKITDTYSTKAFKTNPFLKAVYGSYKQGADEQKESFRRFKKDNSMPHSSLIVPKEINSEKNDDKILYFLIMSIIAGIVMKDLIKYNHQLKKTSNRCRLSKFFGTCWPFNRWYSTTTIEQETNFLDLFTYINQIIKN